MTDALTSPEQYAERLVRKRIVAEIIRCGGCKMCQHRCPNPDFYGIYSCVVGWRAFPLCMKDGEQPGFELDAAARSDA